MIKKITLTDVVARLVAGGSQRQIIAIAGAPGSGKSTVAEKLSELLNARQSGLASILPMDGFHYDDHLLTALGRKDRKGAPDTFDVGGFYHTLLRMRARDEEAVAVPVFDRDLEISRGGARLISRDIPIVIVEGNYLLLRDAPWNSLKALFDLSVMVQCTDDTLRKRLTARWAGYQLPEAEVRRRVDENDMPNGRLVREASVAADFDLAN
ncbi:MAG: nucleoside/nucleotide kinase family protein [Alphaproteobacteria bacterium]|nr:nucleoside/nucleotide kinase family protein [Alphaproteobacteria bacterium]